MWRDDELSGGEDGTALEPGNQALLAHWESLKAGRTAPRRADLDPRQMRRLLPRMFMAESDGLDGYSWRLAGTGLCQLFRREMTGRDFLEGWTKLERGVICRFLAGVIEDHRPVALRLRLHTDRGQVIQVEMLALPLLSKDGVTTRIMGSFSPLDEPQTEPHGAITEMELAAARFLTRPVIASDAAQVVAARRQFRVIAGGLS